MNYVDPDGMEISFIVRQQNKNIILKYQNNNFWHSNGSRYNPGIEKLSSTLYHTLEAFRKINSSGDEVLINKLQTLESSKNTHWVEERKEGGSGVEPYSKNTMSEDNKNIKAGDGISTRTHLDLSEKRKKELETFQGIPSSNLSIITHEFQHQYDYDIGNMKDAHSKSSAKDPAEIRAVRTENRARKIENLPKRTTYDREKIIGL